MANVEHETHRDTLVGQLPMKAADRAARVLAGGFVASAAGGIIAVVLAILGLIGLSALRMSSIAGIVFGVALLCEGGSVLAEFNKVVGGTGFASRIKIESSTLALFIGGLGGGILSLLALTGVLPFSLMSIAAIVYGLSLVLASYVTYAVDLALPWRDRRPMEFIPGARTGASGLEVLAGLGAIVLGIVALAGMAQLTLNLVAMLCVGCAAAIAASVSSNEYSKLV